MVRSHLARITSSRLAAISRAAAAANFSMSTMWRTPPFSSTASPLRSPRRDFLGPRSATRTFRPRSRAAAPRCMPSGSVRASCSASMRRAATASSTCANATCCIPACSHSSRLCVSCSPRCCRARAAPRCGLRLWTRGATCCSRASPPRGWRLARRSPRSPPSTASPDFRSTMAMARNRAGSPMPRR